MMDFKPQSQNILHSRTANSEAKRSNESGQQQARKQSMFIC